MTLIYRVLQELTEEEKRAGETQVFIGHEFRRKDLRVKVERGLQTLGLQAYFADKHLTGEYVLDKILQEDPGGPRQHHGPETRQPECLFRVGRRIGLNKPVFIVCQHGYNVPRCWRASSNFIFPAMRAWKRTWPRRCQAG